MHPSNDRGRESSLPEKGKEKASEKAEADQKRSDPPLTEIKGVTDPEEYVEPKVEDEPKKKDSPLVYAHSAPHGLSI